VTATEYKEFRVVQDPLDETLMDLMAIQGQRPKGGDAANSNSIWMPVTPRVTKILINSLKLQLSLKVRANQVVEV
jgi:hypothetical protein